MLTEAVFFIQVVQDVLCVAPILDLHKNVRGMNLYGQ